MCEIFLKDFSFQNKEIPVLIIGASFTESIRISFPNYKLLLTARNHTTLIAGLPSIQQFSYHRIHPVNSVLTLEVLAICQVLDELAVPEKDILPLSGSYSSLSSLKNNLSLSYVI